MIFTYKATSLRSTRSYSYVAVARTYERIERFQYLTLRNNDECCYNINICIFGRDVENGKRQELSRFHIYEESKILFSLSSHSGKKLLVRGLIKLQERSVVNRIDNQSLDIHFYTITLFTLKRYSNLKIV